MLKYGTPTRRLLIPSPDKKFCIVVVGLQLDDEVVLDVAGHALGEEGLDAVHVLPVLRILYAAEYFFNVFPNILCM